MNNILIEDDYNEEWWQPELHCKQCGCTFMWSHYGFSEYPNFCPNCGTKILPPVMNVKSCKVTPKSVTLGDECKIQWQGDFVQHVVM